MVEYFLKKNNTRFSIQNFISKGSRRDRGPKNINPSSVHMCVVSAVHFATDSKPLICECKMNNLMAVIPP